MKNILIGFLGASCIFLMIGATDKTYEQKKEWWKELNEIGRFLPMMVEDRIGMLDSKTGDFFLSAKLRGDKVSYWALSTTYKYDEIKKQSRK